MGSCGVNPGIGPLPNDPDNNSILTASPAFGGIDVSWTYPELNPEAVAYTLLYRSTNFNPDTKVNYRTVSGDYFFDRVNPEQAVEYFYWIQIVSINGTVGTLIGPASAIARPSIEQTIELLTGQITAGQLGQALQEYISKIDLIEGGLSDEIQERWANFQDTLDKFTLFENDLDGIATLVSQEVSRLESSDTAQVQAINVIAAKANDNAALVLQESIARADADSALATTISLVQATAATDSAAVQGLAVNAQQSADAASALAVAKANEAEIAANAYTDGKATATETASINAAKAYTNERELIVKSYADGIVTTAEQAAIDAAAVYTRAQKAAAEIVAAAYADGIVTAEEARAIADATAKANAAQAAASALANAAQGTANQANAAILLEQTARANGDNALAQQTQTLQSTVGQNTSSIEVQSTAIDGLSAQYTVKVQTDVNGNQIVGGFGLATEAGTGTVEAGFDVDRFWVGKLGQQTFPFIIEGNEVFMKEAVMGKLTFNKLRADDGSFVVENGKLRASFIDVSNLVVGVAATFNGDAQSGNYIPGVSGWRILQSGNVEFNNLLARGNIDGSIITGSTIKGSVIQGSAFVALTEAGSPHVGLTSNLSWGSSGNLIRNGWASSSNVDIFSCNYSDTAEYRRFRRYLISGQMTVASGGNRFRFVVYNGASIVADTGMIDAWRDGVYTGTYWRVSVGTYPYEVCGDGGCSGYTCQTYYGTNPPIFQLVNYPYVGDSQLRFAVYLENGTSAPGNFSASMTAINDY